MSHEEILKRIAEIINLSEKRSKIDKDITNLIRFNHYLISNNYAEEFSLLIDILIDMERTMLLYNDTNTPYEKTYQLLEECQDLYKKENNPLYLELVTILNVSINCEDISELTEMQNYFIKRDKIKTFIDICRKLKVGVAKKLIDADKEELKKVVSGEKEKSQRRRNNSYMENNLTKEEKREENIVQIEDANNKQSLEEPMIKGKFKELIYLGMQNILTIDMVISLKNVLNDSEFGELLSNLGKFQIFSKEELYYIKNEATKTMKTINNIDELVAFLSMRSNINLNGLKALIPSIGIDNYYYLVDRLYQFGSIDFPQYKKHLQEFGFLENDNNKKRR